METDSATGSLAETSLMWKWMVVVMVALPGPLVWAQVIRSRPETTVFGTCVGSGLFTDVLGITGNPALLPGHRSFTAALLGSRWVRLPAITRFTAAVWVPAGRGGFTGQGQFISFSGYTESVMGAGYGRYLGDRLQAGVRLNHHHFRFPNGYGRAGSVSADAGLVLHLTDRFRCAVQAVNPLAGSFFGSSEERLTSVYASGVGFQASAAFDWSMELRKEEGQSPELRVTLTYRPVSRLVLSGGFSSRTGAGALRAGFSFSHWQLDLVMQQHPYLGLSPGLILFYTGGK
ncbi:MAG: hypothetical protein RJA57_1582 [Bacteroidota bacterium]|jgi:hypothetical protein